MVRIFVNNIAFYIKKDISVLEALSFLGLRIPRFCYHESLSIAGNCRICLVEIDSALKLVASCAQPILANMQIFSNTTKVLKTRENILESLLLNHPLDCPICDQAGECDLQDQSKVFGGIFSRHIFTKRGVENKIIDPCIKTIMTRCIHCTRCVRFAAEVTGKTFLGTLNRGRFTEIGGFISHFQDSSEISGNVIDLCPVGALTAKPYAFKARPWELRSVETIDLTDGLGSNIYVNLKELDIISILPKSNPFINGQWISNKARFYVDALQRSRISSAWVKNGNKNVAVQPLQLLNDLVNAVKLENKHVFLVNAETDLVSLRLLKKLETAKPNTFKVCSVGSPAAYTNLYASQSHKISALDGIDSNCFVLLATNPRIECAILNVKLRIKSQSRKISSHNFGLRMESTFSTKFINITSQTLLSVIEAKSKYFSKDIFQKGSAIFLIGESFFQRVTCSISALKSHLLKYSKNSVVLLLNKKCNTEALRMLNIKPLKAGDLKGAGTLYCCNLENSIQVKSILDNTSLKPVWIHTHGSQLASACQYILPVLSYLESEGVFINLENRPQKSIKIIENFNPSAVRSLKETITIIKNLTHVEFKAQEGTPFSYLDDILKNATIFDNLNLKFSKIINVESKNVGYCSKYPYKPILSDYYKTNSYTAYSLNMTNYSSKRRVNNNIFLNLIA